MASLLSPIFAEEGKLDLVNRRTLFSEYGESWHLDGMKHNKQNVFDDFQAAAKYLINEKYTSPKRSVVFNV